MKDLDAGDAVLLFSLGGRRFATPASDVRRVAREGRGTPAFFDGTALGKAKGGGRGLVVACDGGEAALAIDEVHGLLHGARAHPLPALASICLPGGAITGVIDHQEELLPLLDLCALLQAQKMSEGDDGGQRSAEEQTDPETAGTQSAG